MYLVFFWEYRGENILQVIFWSRHLPGGTQQLGWSFTSSWNHNREEGCILISNIFLEITSQNHKVMISWGRWALNFFSTTSNQSTQAMICFGAGCTRSGHRQEGVEKLIIAQYVLENYLYKYILLDILRKKQHIM